MAVDRIALAVMVASTLVSLVVAIPGQATFYTSIGLTSCYGSQPQGTMIVAANPALFNNRTSCGRTCQVRCTGSTSNILQPCRNGEVSVRIVDLCPGCAPNQLELSVEAFSMIANPEAGRILIDYTC